MINYSEEILNLFYNPAHAGELDQSSDVLTFQNSSHTTGDRLQLQFLVKAGIIEKACFRCTGSVALIASCEAFCQYVEGKEVLKVQFISSKSFCDILSIPDIKKHEVAFLLDCIASS